MEPKIQSFLFCDSIVPLPQNKIAAYGIFTEIRPPSFPVTMPHFSILISWNRGDGFHRFQVKMLNPKKSLIMLSSPETFFVLPDAETTAHVEIKFNQIHFPEPGNYVFQVILNDEEKETILLKLADGGS